MVQTRIRTTRSGFTLIELLVVIAIIAILIGLLVPAVQKVREAAARTQCTNNLKQLALACHAYHDANKQLPPAVLVGPGIGWTDENNIGPNWVVHILPFIEQGPLFNQYSTSINNYKSWVKGTGGGNDQGWRGMRANVLAMMSCPVESNGQTIGSRTGGGWARGNYACNMGPGDPGATANGGAGGNYNGWGNSGGVMCINWGSRLQTIQDGSSNTVMLAHIRAGWENSDMRGAWAFGMPACSTMANHGVGDSYGPNDTGCCSDDVLGCTDHSGVGQAMGCWSGGYGQGTARSEHPGMVLVAWGDARVASVRNGTSQQIWYWLNSRNDGQTVNPDSY
jgi:prepilin-type N-terminal cleavage/methylation domain-containing protein